MTKKNPSANDSIFLRGQETDNFTHDGVSGERKSVGVVSEHDRYITFKIQPGNRR